VPATGYPRLSQKATQASLVTCGPLKFDHWGRVRGKTVSVKQPEYDQEGSDVDGGVAGEDGAEGDEAGAGGDVGADETECAGEIEVDGVESSVGVAAVFVVIVARVVGELDWFALEAEAEAGAEEAAGGGLPAWTGADEPGPVWALVQEPPEHF